MKERSKILNLMIAKTDRTNSERWLPLWMHSYDTAGVMAVSYTHLVKYFLKKVESFFE